MRPFYPSVKRIPRLYYWIAWALCNLTESSKSPASIAQSNKQWVGTCLYQEWCKPLLISSEAAFGYEQVAQRIANIRLTLRDGRVGTAGGVWKWKLSVYAGSPVCSRPVPLFVSDLADDQAFS